MFTIPADALLSRLPKKVDKKGDLNEKVASS